MNSDGNSACCPDLKPTWKEGEPNPPSCSLIPTYVLYMVQAYSHTHNE